MLGYTENDVTNMLYAIKSADLLINPDENPAIHNYLVMAADFFEGLFAEGRI